MTYQGNCRLGDLFTSRREKGRPGLPTLSVTQSDGLVDRADLDRKQETNLAPEEHLLVKPGDIAYNMMRMWQGAFGVADQEGLVSPAYVVLKPKAQIDPAYAAYFFKTGRMRYLLWAYSHGLTDDRLRLYFQDFAKIPVTIPPPKIQRRIAKLLTTWSQAIAVSESLNSSAAKERLALLRRLMSSVLNHSSDKRGWVKTRLGMQCYFRAGSGFPEIHQKSTVGDYPFIKVSDLNLPGNERRITCANNWVSEAVRQKLHAIPVPEHSVVFAKVGAAVLLNRRRQLTRDTLLDNNLMAAVSRDSIDPSFLYHLLCSVDLGRYVQEGSLPSINQGAIASLKISLPPKRDQASMAIVLDQAEALVEKHSLRTKTLRRELAALMQQLLKQGGPREPWDRLLGSSA